MNAFKLRRFHALVILQCVRWYSKYTISVCPEHADSDGGVELCER